MAGNFLEIEQVGTFGTRFGLLATSKEIGAEALIIVAEGAVKARESLEEHSPIGNFQGGALKRSWLASLPTPLRGAGGQFVAGAAEGYEARAHINTEAHGHMTSKTLHYGKNDIRDEVVDPPWKYALAVSEGRRPLARGNFFMWQRGAARPVFKKFLSARPGNHFIALAQEETSAWVADQTRSFGNRLARSTPGTRAIRRSDLGFPGT